MVIKVMRKSTRSEWQERNIFIVLVAAKYIVGESLETRLSRTWIPRLTAGDFFYVSLYRHRCAGVLGPLPHPVTLH